MSDILTTNPFKVHDSTDLKKILFACLIRNVLTFFFRLDLFPLGLIVNYHSSAAFLS